MISAYTLDKKKPVSLKKETGLKNLTGNEALSGCLAARMGSMALRPRIAPSLPFSKSHQFMKKII